VCMHRIVHAEVARVNLQRVAACCSVLQCVVVCCRVLQCMIREPKIDEQCV